MSFTEKELEIIAKVQVLVKGRTKVVKQVASKRARLDKQTIAVKKTSEALTKDANRLREMDTALDRLKNELQESFKDSATIVQPVKKGAQNLSHYELGRDD